MVEIDNIRTSINSDSTALLNKVVHEYKIKRSDILNYKILKRSLDVRHEPVYSYRLALNLKNEAKYNFKPYHEEELQIKKISTAKKACVVGFGPSGMFCAKALQAAGFEVTVFERGSKVTERVKKVDTFFANQVLDLETNVQFGEGGAGTFSDGKLNTRTKSPYSKYVLETFAKYGANPDICYVANPHVGTDVLRKVVRNFRKDLIKEKVKINFNTLVSDLVIEDNTIKGVIVKNKKIYFDYVILALGHSARDTFKMLSSKVTLEAKPIAVGFRVEHLQEIINKNQFKANYHNPRLGAAEYRLTNKNQKCYTFCMCPGGEVVNATNYAKHSVTNGMSYRNRDKNNANSAILVSISPSYFAGSDPLRCMYFQEKIERATYALTNSYQLPAQNIKDFIENKKTADFIIQPSPKIGVVSANLNGVYPEFINEAVKESLQYWNRKITNFLDGVLIGCETRSSSPIRIVRDTELMTSVNRLYAVGEGAGYAGGITSSALDAIKVSMKIIAKEL